MEYIKRNALVIVLLMLTGYNSMQIDATRSTALKTLTETYSIQLKQLAAHPSLVR